MPDTCDIVAKASTSAEQLRALQKMAAAQNESVEQYFSAMLKDAVQKAPRATP